MVIRLGLNLEILTKSIVTSVSFRPKTGIPPPRNAGTLKTIVCETAPMEKLSPWGSYLLTFSDKMQIFLKEWGISSLTQIVLTLLCYDKPIHRLKMLLDATFNFVKVVFIQSKHTSAQYRLEH